MFWFAEAAPCFYAEKKKLSHPLNMTKLSSASKWHFFSQRSKGQWWHRMTWKVSSTSSQHAKTPDLKCHQRMFLVPCNAQLNFHSRFPSVTVTSSTKASEQDAAKPKEPTTAGNECHQVGRGMAPGNVQGGKCASLWSPPPPWGITQLDSRLFFLSLRPTDSCSRQAILFHLPRSSVLS